MLDYFGASADWVLLYVIAVPVSAYIAYKILEA